MWGKIKHNITARGSLAWLALGIGLCLGGSSMWVTYLGGGIAILLGLGICLYNWKHPTDDLIPSLPDSIKNAKIVWGFWHTGERAKKCFKLGSVKKILLLEPESNSNNLLHVLNQANVSKHDVITNINLTTEEAFKYGVKVRWHNDPTVLSFIICDPSPNIDKNDIVSFSKNAYVVIQVVDRNLVQEEWSMYKKTKAKDPYAFEGYVKWFNDVWENKSIEPSLKVGEI